jgi:hypothetical protein
MTSVEHVQAGASLRSAPRVAFGAVLFLAWGIETLFWVYATVDSAANGDVMPLVTAVAALALLVLLAGMEGLEVSVIDRWQHLFPTRSLSDLAAWLAARQLFVALVVTAVTLLAHRDAIIVPFTSTEVTEGLALGLFDLTWTLFTVLWFAQIFPKHLAATNPDRYLKHLRRTLFPCVEAVRQVGVSQPGEWVAGGVERRLDWPLPHVESIEEAPPAREASLAAIWRELIPERAPGRGTARGATQSERPTEPAGSERGPE